MVTQVVKCAHCDSESIVKNGTAPNGKQKYQCKDCGRASRENPRSKGYPEARKEEILRAYEERSSLRGLARTFGGRQSLGASLTSRNTVTKWLKKKPGHCRP